MNDKMNWKKYTPVIILSFMISFTLGILSFILMNRNKASNPDRILKEVQKKFRKEGVIEGSWIEMTKVPYLNHSYQNEVYYGGLSFSEEDKIKHYEFIADAHDGNIIDIYEI